MYQRSGNKRPPRPGKAVHCENGKPHARVSEGGRADDAGQAQAEGKVLDNELKEGAQREIGDYEKTGGGPYDCGMAMEGDLIEAVDDAGAQSHHHAENSEVGRELADERRERIVSGRLQPFRHAARAELRSNGITAGDGNDDVKHRWQDRPQQELRIVEGGIGEDILLDQERAGREGRA